MAGVLDKRDTDGMSPELGRDPAIVRPTEAQRRIDVSRREPDASLAAWVDYVWIVRWDTAEPYEQQLIPQPVVHVAAEQGRLLVHGVARGTFTRTLEGVGHVVGVAFRPGGFRPFVDVSVGTWSDRVVPAGDVLGTDDRDVAAHLLEPDRTDDELADGISGYLLSVDAQPDPVVDEVAALVETAEHDRAITRAEQLADHAGVGLRTLQRRFSDYVGIGPKWVIQRFRLLDAAAAAHSGEPTDWAALAVDLGFSDQSHLVRAFTAVVGTPPATYESTA
jgi:AraC-like DNA-binding protein